jgi:hypothetical protein
VSALLRRAVARLSWRRHIRTVVRLRRLDLRPVPEGVEPSWRPWVLIEAWESAPGVQSQITASASEQVATTAYPLT